MSMKTRCLLKDSLGLENKRYEEESKHTFKGNGHHVAQYPKKSIPGLKPRTSMCSLPSFEGYLFVKSSNYLRWKCRYCRIYGRVFQIYSRKSDCFNNHKPIREKVIASCSLWSGKEFGMVIAPYNGNTIFAYVHERTAFDNWKKSFIYVNELPTAKKSKSTKRVLFQDKVTIRHIPPLTPSEVTDLFYTKDEITKFSWNSYNIFSRTEDMFNRTGEVFQHFAGYILKRYRKSVRSSD